MRPEPRTGGSGRANPVRREALVAEYAMRLHELLLRVRPGKPERGVRLLLEKAHRLEVSAGLSLDAALAEVYGEAERRVERMLALAARHGCRIEESPD